MATQLDLSETQLPTAVLDTLGKTLDQKTLARLATASSKYYRYFNPILYRQEAKCHYSEALIWAAAHGRLDTAKLCFENGADVNTFGGPHAATREDISKLAQRHTEDFVTWATTTNFSADSKPDWLEAADNPREKMIKLWEPRPDIRGLNFGQGTREFDGTPLHWAARFGQSKMVAYLLLQRADPNLWSKGLCRCFRTYHVINSQHNGVVGPFTFKFRDVPWCPLHLALCYGHHATAIVLLKKGACYRLPMYPMLVPHASGSNGDSSLWWSVLHDIAGHGANGVLRFILQDPQAFTTLVADATRRSGFVEGQPLLQILPSLPIDRRSDCRDVFRDIIRQFRDLGVNTTLSPRDAREVLVQGFRNPAAVLAMLDEGVDFINNLRQNPLEGFNDLIRHFTSPRSVDPETERDYSFHEDVWMDLRSQMVTRMLEDGIKLGFLTRVANAPPTASGMQHYCLKQFMPAIWAPDLIQRLWDAGRLISTRAM